MKKLEIILLASLSTVAVADDTNLSGNKPAQLDDMVVLSNPADSVDETKVIQENSIEKINTDMVMQETSPGMKQPIVRGLMGDQVSLSLDGIKFSNSLFRGGPNQYYSWIPDEFTTAASLNKSLVDASLGGSIDRTLGVDKSQVGISTYFRGHTEYAKFKNNDWEGAVLNTDNDDVATPKGVVAHSAYNQKGAMAVHKNKDYGDTKLVYTRSDDVNRTDKFESGGYYVNELQQYILAEHKLWLDKDRKIYVMPSFQQFEEVINKNSPKKDDVHSTDNMFGIKAGSRYDTTYGSLDYGINDTFEDIGMTTGITNANYNYNTLTAFGMWNGYINDSNEYKLRYSYSLMNATGNGLDRTLGNNAYGANYKFSWTPDSYSYVDLDATAKFPTITNLAVARNDSITELPNANLSQEKAYTATIGHNFYGLDVSLFYKEIQDAIIRTKTDITDGKGGYKWQYNNTNSGHIEGVKASYNRRYDTGTGIYAMVEYLDGRNDYDYWSKMTPLHTELKLTQDVDWLFNDKLIAQWRYAPRVDSDRVSKSDQADIRIKNHNYGYNLVNLGYESMVTPNHKVSLMVNNILNNTGRTFGSSVDFNERMLYLKYNYYF